MDWRLSNRPSLALNVSRLIWSSSLHLRTCSKHFLPFESGSRFLVFHRRVWAKNRFSSSQFCRCTHVPCSGSRLFLCLKETLNCVIGNLLRLSWLAARRTWLPCECSWWLWQWVYCDALVVLGLERRRCHRLGRRFCRVVLVVQVQVCRRERFSGFLSVISFSNRHETDNMLYGVFRFVFSSSPVFATVAYALNSFLDGFVFNFFFIHYDSSFYP